MDYKETVVPNYLKKSCMDADDVDSILKVLESISNALQDDSRYVYPYYWDMEVLTRESVRNLTPSQCLSNKEKLRRAQKALGRRKSIT